MQALARHSVAGPSAYPAATRSVLSRPAGATQHTRPRKQHGRLLHVIKARRQQQWDFSSSASTGNKSSSGRSRRFKLGEAEFTVPEESMWRFGLPAAALVGSAALIGPLVIGLAVGAVAIGGALSAGAVAFTLLPMVIFGALSIAGMAMFGAFATLGFALAIPKLILSVLSLAFVGGGLLLGSSAVGLFSAMQGSTTSSNSNNYGANVDSFGIAEEARERARDAVREAEEEAEARRAAAELRSFDEVLARSEEKRRVEEWRRGRQ